MTTTSVTTSTGPKGFRWLYLILGIVLFVFGVGIILASGGILFRTGHVFQYRYHCYRNQ